MFFLIRFLVCLGALLSLSSCYVEGRLSIMQGAASDTQTQFHIVSADNETLAFFYEGPDKKLYQVTEESVKSSFNILKKYSIFKVNVSGLKPQQEYTLNIVSREKRKLIARRKFYTRKRDRFKRVAIVSCSGDFVAKEKVKNIWKQLDSLRPDAVFMIGDNVYADVNQYRMPVEQDADVLLQRYMDHRFRIPYYQNETLTPTYATWDDHDYGKNDAGREYKLKGKMQEVFHMMYAQDLEPVVNEGPGVSRLVSMGDYNMILLDNRSFRDSKDKKRAELLGQAQRYWLKETLKSKKPGFIISGDQFFGEYHKFGSFNHYYPSEFKKFTRLVKKSKTVYALISGDRHMSEVQKIPSSFLGFESLELTSSPMHSTLYPDRSIDGQNIRRQWAIADSYNFLVLEVFNAQREEMKLGVSYWGEQGLLWKSPFTISKSSELKTSIK